jgi:hypothetical protein
MKKIKFDNNNSSDIDKNIKYIQEYMKSEIYDKFELNSENTIKDFFKKWWKRYIKKNSKYDFADDDIEVLYDRFVDNVVDIRLVDFEKNYGKDVSDWIKSIDKINKIVLYKSKQPLRYIYDEIGNRSINNLKTHLSPNIEKTKKEFQNDFSKKLKAFSDSELNSNDSERFGDTLSDLTNFTNIFDLSLCEEGYTFFIKNIIYKVTGYFGYINQLFGIGKYR